MLGYHVMCSHLAAVGLIWPGLAAVVNQRTEDAAAALQTMEPHQSPVYAGQFL